MTEPELEAALSRAASAAAMHPLGRAYLAAVEQLVAEVRDLRDMYGEMFATAGEWRTKCHHAEERCTELREALAPFAEYAAIVDPAADSSNPIDDTCPPVGGYADMRSPRNARPVPTLGDCRRAAELLAESEAD